MNLNKILSTLFLATSIIALSACDNANQLKEACKDFDPSKDLRLADYIAAADSMAAFSCLPETPSPLMDTMTFASKNSAPLMSPKFTKKKKMVEAKLSPYVVFESNLKKDFDDFAAAMVTEKEEQCGICFDKQWTAYYVELYRNGKPIDSTHIEATGRSQGFVKTQQSTRKRIAYYFANTAKVSQFFKSRNIPKMPWGCWPEKRLSKNSVCSLDKDAFQSIQWTDTCEHIATIEGNALTLESGRKFVIPKNEQETFTAKAGKLLCFSKDQKFVKWPSAIHAEGYMPDIAYSFYSLNADSLVPCSVPAVDIDSLVKDLSRSLRIKKP